VDGATGAESRVAVLGGGAAGLLIAHELSLVPGLRVDLVERAPWLGGLHRSVSAGGLVFDIGAFAFEADNGLMRAFPRLRDVMRQVTYRSKSLNNLNYIDNYPMSIKGYVTSFGLPEFAAACADLVLCKARYRRRDTLPSFARYYLGRRFYHNSGLKSYIERFHGEAEDAIDLEFARQRLEFLSGQASLRGRARALATTFARGGRKDRRRTFWVRPREGFGLMYEVVREQLEAEGIDIVLNGEIRSITREGTLFLITFQDGNARRYHRVISTIPLPTALGYLGESPAVGGATETLTLASLFYRFRGELGFDAELLYNFTFNGEWKRVTMLSKFYGAEGGDEYFVVECNMRRAGEVGLVELAERFQEHVGRRGLFRGSLLYQGGLLTPDAYPFFRRGRAGDILLARQALRERGIETVGRQGTFEYLHSKEIAERAAALAARDKLTACGPGPKEFEEVANFKSGRRLGGRFFSSRRSASASTPDRSSKLDQILKEQYNMNQTQQ
jgi:protoporphyrinogen oxidase